PLAGAYGLAKHRDGRWEWAIALGESPSPRYQHAAVFVNARLHVSGGALGGGRMVEDASSVAVLDTAAGVWCDRKSVVTTARTGRYSADVAGGEAELTRRCRHAAAAVGELIFMYGGLRGGALLDDLLVADDFAASETSSGYPGDSPTGTSKHPLSNNVSDGTIVMDNHFAPSLNGHMSMDISTENAVVQRQRSEESLVKASAAEAEAISKVLEKARQSNGDVSEYPDRDQGPDAFTK
ncbi:hypothetical protein KI387_035281, partial [Taxus chinensis]